MKSTYNSGVGNYDCQPKSHASSVFVNNVLLEYNHIHLFVYCIQLLLYYNKQQVYLVVTKPHDPQSLK